jgi:hypothetical protein
METKKYFGRISDSAFEKYKGLDELFHAMTHVTDGSVLINMGTPQEIRQRFEAFKEDLKTQFPELTFEEILLIVKYQYWTTRLFEWHGADIFLTGIEYELRNDNRRGNK